MVVGVDRNVMSGIECLQEHGGVDEDMLADHEMGSRYVVRLQKLDEARGALKWKKKLGEEGHKNRTSSQGRGHHRTSYRTHQSGRSRGLHLPESHICRWQSKFQGSWG